MSIVYLQNSHKRLFGSFAIFRTGQRIMCQLLFRIQYPEHLLFFIWKEVCVSFPWLFHSIISIWVRILIFLFVFPRHKVPGGTKDRSFASVCRRIYFPDSILQRCGKELFFILAFYMAAWSFSKFMERTSHGCMNPLFF